MPLNAVSRFFRHDAAGGILLMVSAVLALVIYNSPLSGFYDEALNATLAITLDDQGLEKPLILWINDGLMAIFFFLIGLELKREFMEGKLKNPSDVILPGVAAFGGMAVPALIYAFINWGNPETIHGWAIPAATDIAFALGVLALLGKHAHPSLKIFLLTLAILDDMGAILVIALFYTAELKVHYLGLALLPLAALLWLNLRGTHRVAPAILLGVLLWVLVLKSGVHATLAGVILAFLIPIKDQFGKSPLHSLEHALEPYVYFLIVPIFAFANAGVSVTGLSLADLVSAVPVGIAAGLFFGKQIGVFAFTFAVVKLGFARLPHGVSWVHIYGLSCLAGIGFTMSLFIGGLSFTDPVLAAEVRLGVLTGSILSALLGYAVLRAFSTAEPVTEARAQPAE
ncbi:Na+/H+ antiporter NhaA [Algicella marina]|uniref:Na(+)/H(+) antiporter NhaA n=1 Tax=Algicella marina TaxID=2683284 RepID=A0A6P1SXD9_9RHOB|nr:Na+/H+ antiporter NhaA [Algicella marina]QHQ34003.1 Na+/H+ antiporter NhaA [Algicella marina]